MSTYLEDAMRHEAWNPRGLQLETGASQAYSCRAEHVLRLNGAPEGDDFAWSAFVGSAIHASMAVARKAANPRRLVEQKFTYRGVPATVDDYTPDVATVTDLKTKDDNDAVMRVELMGPDDAHRAQVHLGAAALIEAGHPVTTVALFYVPRSGKGQPYTYAWEEPFNRGIADAAVNRIEESSRVAIARAGQPWVDQAEGIRDKDYWWCSQYCPFLEACRPTYEATETIPDSVRDVATLYAEADVAEKAAKSAKAALKPLLDDFPKITLDEFTLTWSGGNKKPTSDIDEAQVRAEYQSIIGPLPMVEGYTLTARALSVKRIKK